MNAARPRNAATKRKYVVSLWIIGLAAGGAWLSLNQRAKQLPAGSGANPAVSGLRSTESAGGGPAETSANKDSLASALAEIANATGVAKASVAAALRDLSPSERILLLRRVLASQTGEDRAERLRNLFRAWAVVDAAGAFHGALSVPDFRERDDGLREVFRSGAPGSAELLLSLLEASPQINPSLRNELASTALIHWAEASPAAAAAFIDAHKNLTIDPMSLGKISGAWARQDGPAALAWATSQLDRYGSIGVQSALAEWWQYDPAGAEGYASSTKDETLRGQLRSIILNRMAMKDSSAAQRRAEQLQDPADRSKAYMVMAAGLAGRDGENAARWVLTLPEAERRDAVGVVSRFWSAADANAAEQWISNLTNSGERDAAIGSMTSTLLHTDPARAMSWALQIADENQRTNVFLSSFERWRSMDPMSANLWLEKSNLPPDLKTYLQ